MRVLVLPVLVRSGTMTVAQVAGNLALPARADIGEGRVDRRLRSVGLGRQRVVDGGLREVDAALGVSDHLRGLERRLRHQQRGGIGVADVLARLDHDATRDELGVLASVDHPRKPVHRGIGVGTAHRLDKRGDDVVVHVAVLVVGQAAARVGLLDVIERDLDGIGLAALGLALPDRAREGDLAREFQRGQRAAAITGGERADGGDHLVAHRVPARKTLWRRKGAAHEALHVRIAQVLELHHAAAREQRRVHLEIRVLRGGADHDDRAVLDRVQQRILLRAGKPVDLVDEQDGPAVEHHEPVLGLVDLATQVLHRARDRGDLDELAFGVRGDDMGQRGLARSRGTIQDHARQHVVLDGAPQPRTGPHRLFLTHVIVKRAGPHAHRQRRVLELLAAFIARE